MVLFGGEINFQMVLLFLCFNCFGKNSKLIRERTSDVCVCVRTHMHVGLLIDQASL